MKIEIPSTIKYTNKTKQEELLKDFNKKGVILPLYESSIDMSLDFLFNELYCDINKDLIEINENDTTNRLKLYLGPSGIGKTFINSAISVKKFTIYSICSSFSEKIKFWTDKTFKLFIKKMEVLENNNDHILYGDNFKIYSCKNIIFILFIIKI
jgi:hypothetical protein